MRVKIMLAVFVLVTGLAALTMPLGAQDQINYISQPDELTVFLNDVVFVHDDLRVPLDVETRIVFTPKLSWCNIIGPMDLHRSFTTIGRDLI